MPLARRTLTQAELTEHLRRAEQLRASGVGIEMPKEWEENSRVLDIVLAGPAENAVFENFQWRGLLCCLSRVVALQPVTLTDWRLRTHHDDQIVAESFDDRNPLRPGWAGRSFGNSKC